jgi:hypothetical protein
LQYPNQIHNLVPLAYWQDKRKAIINTPGTRSRRRLNVDDVSIAFVVATLMIGVSFILSWL